MSFSTPENCSEPRTISIMLADDVPLMRQALKDLLEKQPDFRIVGEAADGKEAVELAKKLKPQVIIMDIGMPKLSGLEATKQIKAVMPEIAILVLTVHTDSGHILGLLEAGAAGYLAKSIFGEELLHAVRSVVTGDAILSYPILQQLLQHAVKFPKQPVAIDAKEKLSVRELEILRMAATGTANKDIARALDLSVNTVKGYFVTIFSKLRVSSRTEAILTGLRNGFISLDA